jgi:hypothetical protein
MKEIFPTNQDKSIQSGRLLNREFILDSIELLKSSNKEPLVHLQTLTSQSTKEELCQNSNNEEFSTYHDRKLHDHVKHLWEQDHMRLCENSPRFSNIIRERSQDDCTMSE